MQVVLLSGGSGKRLWPLSNDSRSKQFLRILTGKNGKPESMAERVWRQLNEVNLAKSTVVATGESQVDMIKNQLGENVPVIVEPSRRDTFPAIALTAVYLYSRKGVNLDEVVTVLPVDPYVEDVFFEHVKLLEQLLETNDKKLALIGVNPTHPSSKYGYIVPDLSTSTSSVYEVNHFVEKPEEEEAKQLIEKQALWNCGVFAFRLDFIISRLQVLGYPIQYEELLKQYHRLPKTSFDYEVVEHTDRILALPYNGDWKDLGTWNTLTEEMSTNRIGKAMCCEQSVDTHVVNELNIPIAVLGIQNAVVAASPDGILVTSKKESPKIKSLISMLQQRPMYEEKLWGWYKVLDYTSYSENRSVVTKRVCIYSGKNLDFHQHQFSSEVITIIKGSGQILLENELYPVKEGDVFEIPVGVKHAILANTEMEFIEVQKGTVLGDDYVFYSNDWNNSIGEAKVQVSP